MAQLEQHGQPEDAAAPQPFRAQIQHLNEDYPPNLALVHQPNPSFPAQYFHVDNASLRGGRVYDPMTSMVIPAANMIVPLVEEEEPSRNGSTVQCQGNSNRKRAYWIRKLLRESIGGAVYYAVQLKHISELSGTEEAELMWNQSCVWAITDVRVVVKQFNLGTLRGNQWEMMRNEIMALRYIQARHEITPFHNIVVPKDILTGKLQHLWIVTPFYEDGDLFDFALQANRRLGENEARPIFRQMILGLQELRRIGLYHRDVAPENMMIHEGRLILIDLGTAGLVPHDETTGERTLSSPQPIIFGRWVNLPPEIVLGQAFDGFTVDFWAVAVTLFRLVAGELPWDRAHATDNGFQLARHGRFGLLCQIRGVELSPELTDMLQGIFREDPRERLGLPQVLRHPWMIAEGGA